MDEKLSTWVNARSWKARWETIDKLPGGGQGDAFRAKRLSDGKIGFLKTIKSRNDPERRARFFREASAYDSFGVDGIPRFIESNAHRHGEASIIPYVVTEFVEGPTLRAWRDSQLIVSIETSVTVTTRLLEILHSCHAEGCVHRDVKPDNIILQDGDPARVWLLDFGISYHDLPDVDFRTEDWQEVGNRFLRLPELSAGSRSKQDPRSDICFAAGILFYVCTGDHPDVLEDSEGRLPHQRSAALSKLQQVTSSRLSPLLALFDEAFATRLAHRFATARAMQERMQKMIDDQTSDGTIEADIAMLREAFDTAANRRLTVTIAKLSDGLKRVQRIFDEVQQSIGGNLSSGQTGWAVTGESGQSTLFWTRPGSSDRLLSVTYQLVPTGEELIVRMSGETVYRTDLVQPDYGESFHAAVTGWLAARLRATLSDPLP